MENLMKRSGISDLDLHQLISIVEWWENDSLDIDSNQHVLFVFKEYWSDILVTDKNINEINKRLSDMSQICGYEIKITLEFHVEFTNRIIYPEQFYGDHYYRPKYNKILHSILKIIGINIPLEPMQHSRFFQNNNAGPDISL
ncbi:MAG: hypothetical protein ACLRSX_06825 [Akkermansia sp.]|nr:MULTISPECIES: hypothetical protein [Akkermansia]MBO1689141.1 hypothetical protein [Akkermansia sp. GGCC_0220]QWP72076.1 hypothetical protein J5W79_06770 [Akkermansia massiliensis]